MILNKGVVGCDIGGSRIASRGGYHQKPEFIAWAETGWDQTPVARYLDLLLCHRLERKNGNKNK
ncbi:MAG: hypothetical protein OXH90_03475 [Paracoccaceae bacterium]|nr:hypothetical protein [Paracoccaceae bacterium]MDE2916891.1 hypothetical protein [Paracoccaceae bacterium]